MAIPLDKTKGKYIYFLDRNGAYRINKVIALNGNTITTEDAIGGKERIHPETNKIFGVITREKSPLFIEDIDYKPVRMGNRLKNKTRKREIARTIIKPLKQKRRQLGRPKKTKDPICYDEGPYENKYANYFDGEGGYR
jgi:hypothetical protein